jgi:ATP-dependent helicase HrpB
LSSGLPILEIIPELKEKFLQHRILILQAPPGAGKSTALPLELLHEPWLKDQKMIMLEPRRLAARSVAARMSVLLEEEVGTTVGYRVRFENRTSDKTRIEVVTEGILTRMMQNDSALDGTGLVIFDEFHERSLHADLALALCLQVQQVLRDDLRILIMSATLDSGKLSALLNNAPILTSQGKQYPVTLQYLGDDQHTHTPVRMANAIKKALHEQEGDVLAFFPGTGEIHRCMEILEKEHVSAKLQPLYGDLPFREQQEAIEPDKYGSRKVVLATSIAETSLTIEGIRTVIDCGLSRVPRFDTRTGLTRLETVKVTKDSADQRAGRAGRLGAGVCYRLWSEGAHIHLTAQRNPEILEADLAPLLLETYQWGIKDIHELKWVTPPLNGAVLQAKELLLQLEAVEKDRITVRGKEMLRFPTHPRIAHLLLEALEHDKKESTKKYSALAADIAALLEERDPLTKESGTDITLRIDVLRKWRTKKRVNADRNALERIERSAAQWRRLLRTETDNSSIIETDAGMLIAAAYPERIAKKADKNSERFRLASGRIAKLQPHDPLAAYEWLAVAHLDAGTTEGKIFLAAPMDVDDVMHLAEEKEILEWDEKNQSIKAALEKRIGGITIQSSVLKNVSTEAKNELWCSVIRKEGSKLLNLPEHFQQWCIRIQCLKKWSFGSAQDDNARWPDVSEAHLLSTLEEWLVPLLENVSNKKQLEQLDPEAFKNLLLEYDLQQKLNKLAPAQLLVPSGSMIPVVYAADGSAPELHVRIQEIFSMKSSPTVNEGQLKMKLFLLSPARRPVQVTQDLESFWKNHYPEVRKELKIKYPRHFWPEDPLTAQAVKGVIRKRK